MDWTNALAISQSLGFIFAMAARFLPFIPTRITPKVGIVSIFLTNIVLLWQKFVESAGLATASLLGAPDERGIYMAGFGSILKPLLTLALPVLLAAAQYAINRLVHEYGIKPVISPTGVPAK